MPRGDILSDIEQRFDELRREMLGGLGTTQGPFGVEAGVRAPVLDVVEDDDQYVLAVELPGVDKKDIQLDVSEEGVRVRARREERAQQGGEGRGYLRRERASETFERRVDFPEMVSPDGARATFRNGVLEVTVPKASPEKRRGRSIDIE